MISAKNKQSIMRALLVFVAVVAAVTAEQFSYEGYKVFRLHAENEDQLKLLVDISKNNTLDFWSSIRAEKPIDVMVKPEVVDTFGWVLYLKKIQHEILIDNVEDVVVRERINQLRAPRIPQGRISFTKYHRHQEINDYLDQLARDHSDIVQVENAGKSYEGRDMKIIKISTNPNANKPIILIDGGIHAREWVAPAEALFIINQLVENPANRGLLDRVDWHVLPVVNPDGYEYSHTHDRFWRKSRSPGKRCYGADPNRNFDFHWGVSGASKDECDVTYMGREPFSEVESRVLANHATKYKQNIKLYLTFHSYGEYLLFPWGYAEILPENHEELQELGEFVANTIRQVHGTVYTVGTSAIALYPAAGGSDDWVKGVAGVELAYTVELRGGGQQGFDPPPSEILEIVDEAFAGVKAYHHYIQAKFG